MGLFCQLVVHRKYLQKHCNVKIWDSSVSPFLNYFLRSNLNGSLLGCYLVSFQSQSGLNAGVDICVVTICGVVVAIREVVLGFGGPLVVGIGRVVVGFGRVVVGIGKVVVGMGRVVVGNWQSGCGNWQIWLWELAEWLWKLAGWLWKLAGWSWTCGGVVVEMLSSGGGTLGEALVGN